MAHNRSRTKLRSDVLGSALNIYRGWLLKADCGSPGCPVGRSHRLEALARYYPGATVGDVLNRLRCLKCGQGPREAVIVEAYRRRRVPLRGPEVSRSLDCSTCCLLSRRGDLVFPRCVAPHLASVGRLLHYGSPQKLDPSTGQRRPWSRRATMMTFWYQRRAIETPVVVECLNG